VSPSMLYSEAVCPASNEPSEGSSCLVHRLLHKSLGAKAKVAFSARTHTLA